MTKEKADLAQVRKAIAPYIRKVIFQKAYVEMDDVILITQLLNSRYTNTAITAESGKDGRLYLVIKVHRLLNGGTLTYEMKKKGKSMHMRQQTDPLSWIDRLEELDALLDD